MPNLLIVKSYLDKSDLLPEERDVIVDYIDILIDHLDAKVLELNRMHRVKRRMRDRQFKQQLKDRAVL